MFAGEDIHRGERIQYIKGNQSRILLKSTKESQTISNRIGQVLDEYEKVHRSVM